MQTRRQFLGRAGKVLGWAAVASLLGSRGLTGDAHAADYGRQAVEPKMR